MIAPTRSPGRPRGFDEETVLDRATEVFWERGYAATSVADLVEATGVHKPSLYRTFGSKEELFATVLRRYFDVRLDGLVARIESTGPGVAGIHEFLDSLRTDLAEGPARRGCLLVASSSELRGDAPGFADFGAAYRAAVVEMLRPLVARAGGSDDELDMRTQVMATWLLGLDVTTRGGAGLAEIDRSIDAMRSLIATWA